MLMLHAEEIDALSGQCGLIDGGPELLGKIRKCTGNMMFATGLDLPIGHRVRVRSDGGEFVQAEVTAFDGDCVILTSIDQEPMISKGAAVEVIGPAGNVGVGQELLGRILDPLGEPLDEYGPIETNSSWPLNGIGSNVLNRGQVTMQLEVGVRAIDALLPVGQGQRMALIAGSGVGKTVLMQQLTMNCSADVVVVGLIGERAREISDFVAASKNAGALGKMCIVAVPANHSPILRIKAAKRALAIAEYYRDQGKDVLLMIDSLTRVAHAQREIGLSLGEPPTLKGYPPSAIALIPQIVERAGRDTTTGGSITAFYTILADGDDMDDPIVDAARAITDGHIILSRSLAEQNVFPAIDIGKSISRVAQDIVDTEHLAAMRNYRALWSRFQENRDLILMGAYQAGSDALLDEAVSKRPDQLAFLCQDSNAAIEQNVSIDRLKQEFGS